MSDVAANGVNVTPGWLVGVTLGAAALVVNAALPYFGFVSVSATWTLILSVIGVLVLVLARPVFSVSLLYPMLLAISAFAAGVGIEAGGVLTETGVQGEANGAFSRLLLFYVVFLGTALYGFNRYLHEPTGYRPSAARLTLQPSGVVCAFALAIVIMGFGVAAGLTDGFALLNGVNRYALRNDGEGTDSAVFNVFLNNQMFLALTLGALATSSKWSIKFMAIIAIFADVGLNVLHGEQFMAVLHFGLTVLTPVVAVLVARGKPVVGYLGVGAIIAVVVGGASVFYAYQGQGLDISNTVDSRLLLQGQAWYVVDHDATLLHAPFAGGMPAFYRFVHSLTSLTAPSFFNDGEMSGLRDLMIAYCRPVVLDAYVADDVSFTMGQMAVPVFWFGFAGGLIFVAFTGVIYGVLCALQIAITLRGGVIMLWLTAKVLTYATFALQQGEYWSFFGSRMIVYCMIALAWWMIVDVRAAARIEQAGRT